MEAQVQSLQSTRRFVEESPREELLGDLPVTERRHDLAGVSTSVLVGGAGHSLVLLHGPGESAVGWMRVIPELVASHHVIAPDLPGHGRSRVEEGVTMDRRRALAWLGELIDRESPEPPTLVGHVLGGAMAARFAVDRGEKLGRLVLVDSLGLVPFRPAPRFALTMLGFVLRPTAKSYDRFMRQCSFDLDGLRKDMGSLWEPFVEYNLSLARSLSPAARRLMREVGLPRIPPEDLARIEVPTTLVWGRHDRANRLRVAELASERYGWPLHVIEDCADDPARDRPEAFLDALGSALAAPLGSSGSNARASSEGSAPS
jgi:pimeloyl-ACP methyl ester carboxylesterase